VPYTDIVTTLQTGLIEGGITSDYAFVTGGLAEEVQVFTLTKHSYDTGMMLANASWFESLSANNKITIMEAYGDTEDFRSRSRAYSRNQLENLPARIGTSVYDLSDQQRSKWVKITATTHNTLLDRIGAPAIALYDIIDDAKALYSGIDN